MNDMQQPAAAKGGSKLIWVLLGCFGCAGLAVLGVILFGGGLFFGIMKMAEPYKNDVNVFLRQAASGDVDGAYEHFSEELKQVKDKASFKAEVEGNKHLFDIADTTFNHVNMVNDQCMLRGTVTGKDGKVYGAKFTYIKRGESLKLLGYGLRPTPYGENE